MNIPDRLTDLTRADFVEIAAFTNPTPGLGVEIQRKAGTVEVAISETQFKRMLWAFNKNGGFSSSLDDLDSISLDPQ